MPTRLLISVAVLSAAVVACLLPVMYAAPSAAKETDSLPSAATTSAPAPLTEKERALFGNLSSAKQMPDSLARAYANYVKCAEDGDAKGLAQACLPQAVEISDKLRQADSEDGYGQGINLPFLKKGFASHVQLVRKDSESCWLIRTGSTAIWFVETAKTGWKVYKVIDKPID